MPSFFMKYLFVLIFLWCSTNSATAQTVLQFNNELSPEELGYSSQGFDALSSFLDKAGSSAMVIVSSGQVVYEWGSINKKHTIHSIRKPLISALYGILIERGIVDTTATLESLNINDIPPSLSATEKSARVIDLLKSRSGVYHDAAANSSGMIAHRPERNSHLPGEHYFYNNWDFNVLGGILEQQTGQSVYELFDQEIAQKVGMEHYEGSFTSIDGEDPNSEIPDSDGFYQFERSKSKFPAHHFRLTATDMAKFGQLYLNEGSWNGEQIIPKNWIDLSTQAYSVTNKQYGIGYGMLWYVLMKNEQREHRSFYHTGNVVHFLAIYPSSKMVVVHRVDTEKSYTFNQGDFYRMIDLVWASKLNR